MNISKYLCTPLTLLLLLPACADEGAATDGGESGESSDSESGEGSGESESASGTSAETSADSGETGETGGTGEPGDCSGWEMFDEFFPEVSIDSLGACTGAGALIEESLMNFDGISITGASVVGADGSNVAQPCVEVLCDDEYAYIASNALPHYDPQAQPIFDTADTPIVHRVPLSSSTIASDVATDPWLDVAGCEAALSMNVTNTTPSFPPSSHCYFQSEDGTQSTGELHVTDGVDTVHKVLCYGQTASMITGVPAFAPCEEARPDPYGSPLFRAYADPGTLFVDFCGTHPAAITHNHWVNEVCLEQDENNQPVNSYATGATAFVVEDLDAANCTEESDVVGWVYDGNPMRGSCVCMARDGSGDCTDLRRARSGYVYAGLGAWANDASSTPNISTTDVANSHLGTELAPCTTQAECCSGPGQCTMYCQPLLVESNGGVEMESRCVSADYSWCSHEFLEHASPTEDAGYVYLDRCNGIETADGYTYVGTASFPYVNSCYKGAPSETATDETYIRLDMGPGMP